ncbi:MAG: hypothetical protein U0325_12360 [Polyangiales bacterium]
MHTDETTPGATRVVEPSEGAFSIVVPDGWRVQAGIARQGAEPRPWYLVQSPGGGAELRAIDPRMPASFVEAPFGMMLLPGMVPRPYLAPQPFAEEYGRFFARERGAARFEVVAWRDVDAIVRDDPRPDAVARVQTLMALGAVFGGVEFVAPDRGRRGVVDVVTLRTPMMGALAWTPMITAYDGPDAAWPAARDTLMRIVRSYVSNDAWQQRLRMNMHAQHEATMAGIRANGAVLQMQAQSGMDAIAAHAARAQASAQTAAEISAMQSAGFAARQASLDESHRRAVNGVREVTDLYDPVSQQVLRGAPAGVAHWWSDGAGRVVGTDDPHNPDPQRLHGVENLDDRAGDPTRRR